MSVTIFIKYLRATFINFMNQETHKFVFGDTESRR